MVTVTDREAKTHLAHLIDRAVTGEPVVIAKAGTPLVQSVAIGAPKRARRLGLLSGDIVAQMDFDRMGERTIAALFGRRERTVARSSGSRPSR